MCCVLTDRALSPTPVQSLVLPSLAAAGARLSVMRADLNDAELGGNKWYKLQGHLARARAQGCRRVLSFGGAWSNHLHALAAAGYRYGFGTIGVVRGDRQTAMLDDCRRWGMEIRQLSFGEYRRRHEPDVLQRLQADYPDAWLVPEGGSGAAGTEGFRALADELVAAGASVVAVAMGTGTTAIGLARWLPPGVEVWGFPVLPLTDFAERMAQWAPDLPGNRVRVWHGMVDTRYGRPDQPLLDYLLACEQRHSLVLDPVYTVKLMWALETLAGSNLIPSGAHVVALHGGGLQGRRGFDLPVGEGASC